DGRDLRERGARCGDFFIYTDDTSAQLNFIVEALQMKLRADIERADRGLDNNLTQRCFDWLPPPRGTASRRPIRRPGPLAAADARAADRPGVPRRAGACDRAMGSPHQPGRGR